MNFSWKNSLKIIGVLSLFVGTGLSGYYLGHKNATEAVLEALQWGCSRRAIIEFPDGTHALCMKMENFYQPIDKDKEV